MPVLLGAVEHRHPVVLGGEAVGDLAGAVGRAVVDDEHAKARGRGARASTSPAAITMASTFSASL